MEWYSPNFYPNFQKYMSVLKRKIWLISQELFLVLLANLIQSTTLLLFANKINQFLELERQREVITFIGFLYYMVSVDSVCVSFQVKL